MNSKFSGTINRAVLLTAIVLSTDAGANVNEAWIKEQPHAIYHVIKQKTLLEAANLIANRSGITFKINADLENDVITKKLAADNWQMALSQLLDQYNYTTESEHNTVKKVLITSRHENGNTSANQNIGKPALIMVEPNFAAKLPGRYKDFAAGSVFPVKLPIDRLHSIPLGGEVTLDLPIGQYQVKHDNLVEHNNENSTWIGYLNDEGKGYRIFLSQGETGIIGNIYTPDGAYNIETTDGETVIVDIGNSGLENAGFYHDEAETSDEAVDSPENSFQMGDKITKLENAARKARAKANALAAEVKQLYSKYLQTIKPNQDAQIHVDRLRAIVENTKNKFSFAKAALKESSKNAELKRNVSTLKAIYSAQKSEFKAALKSFKAINKNMLSLKKAYDKKQARAKAAEAKAQTLEAEYSTMRPPSAASASDPGAQTDTVVDLMVLYTHVNQTPGYAKQRIQYLVDVSNQAYKDSGINMSLRLVHTRQTSYPESGANAKALGDLAAGKGAFSDTASLRNRYGADLVVLFRPLYANSTESCGITYVGFAKGGNANPSLGFSTVSDGYSRDAKSNYYCDTNTFTHEIGHAFGNVHDREYSDFAGKFNYSYAWGINGKFGTVMSYYGPSVMLFATPNLKTQCAGTACGFPEGHANASDQTRTTNYTAPLVGRYKPTKVTTPVIQ
ncbi:reprolysin-like metallopeptidase [Methylomonas sp. MgM2]